MTVKIDESALEKVFEDPGKDIFHFLDRTTGKITVMSLTAMRPQELMDLKKKVAAEPGRFIQIPKAHPQDNYRDMLEFIEQVKDKKLKERLTLAQQSPGPFKEFRQVLEGSPREKDQWAAFKKAKTGARVLSWKRQFGLL